MDVSDIAHADWCPAICCDACRGKECSCGAKELNQKLATERALAMQQAAAVAKVRELVTEAVRRSHGSSSHMFGGEPFPATVSAQHILEALDLHRMRCEMCDSFASYLTEHGDHRTCACGGLTDDPDAEVAEEEEEPGPGCPNCGEPDRIGAVVNATGDVSLTLASDQVEDVEWGVLTDFDIHEAIGLFCRTCGHSQEVESNDELFRVLRLKGVDDG